MVTARVVAAPGEADLEAAAAAVAERLEPTPLVPAPALGPDVHLNLECQQPTGSFKVRGATAALARVPPGEAVVTASAGNHGLAIAWSAAAQGRSATVVVPDNASAAKLSALEALPVRLVRHGGSYDEAEQHALALDGVYVSPYNDTGVIAGQASLGRELPPAELTVVVPIGGGGLASGVGLWASACGDVRVIGVEADASPAFGHALRAGELDPIVAGPTLADGFGGNVEPGSVTFELVRDHVDAVTAVSEEQIREAIRFLARAHGLVAEGAAAVGVAAVLAGVIHADGPTVVVVTGRNIALPVLAEVLAG